MKDLPTTSLLNMSPSLSTFGEFLTKDLVGQWSPLEIGAGVLVAAGVIWGVKKIARSTKNNIKDIFSI